MSPVATWAHDAWDWAVRLYVRVGRWAASVHPPTLLVWLTVTVGTLGIAVAVGRALFGKDPRFFRYEQEWVVARAVGPACVWNRTHGLPFAVLVWAWLSYRQTPTDALWITVGVAGAATAFGLPIVRTSGRCCGPIVRAHRHAAAKGGSTSIWNLELACERHNGDQSDTHSVLWAFTQWPWTPLVYLTRTLVALAALTWLLVTDGRARRKAAA